MRLWGPFDGQHTPIFILTVLPSYLLYQVNRSSGIYQFLVEQAPGLAMIFLLLGGTDFKAINAIVIRLQKDSSATI